jgi:hypothetical protein
VLAESCMSKSVTTPPSQSLRRTKPVCSGCKRNLSVAWWLSLGG